MKLLVINGINLNMTGKRETEIYGTKTLSEINEMIAAQVEDKEYTVDFFSTNFEGEFVEKLYSSKGNYDGIIMNAGAWSHYSYGVRDAVAGCGMPVIEVHMSNVYAREEFRHNQILAPLCVGLICGFGWKTYVMALDAMANYLNNGK